MCLHEMSKQVVKSIIRSLSQHYEETSKSISRFTFPFHFVYELEKAKDKGVIDEVKTVDDDDRCVKLMLLVLVAFKLLHASLSAFVLLTEVDSD